MYTLAVALPEDMTELNKKYADTMAKITCEILSKSEVNELIGYLKEHKK